MVLIFKDKGDVESCGNNRSLKLMSHTRKSWERVEEARLRAEVSTCKQQHGFMPKKSTTDAELALRMCREVQKRSEGAAVVFGCYGEGQADR